MRTHAAVAFEPGRPLEIVELDLEGPREREVLVEYAACGVCHSDLSAISGLVDVELPAVLGHEGAGIVREVAPDVTDVGPGDHVIPLFQPQCGRCGLCLSGKTNVCQIKRDTRGGAVMLDGTTRFSFEGRPIRHGGFCSAYSRLSVVPDVALARIREDAPLERVCLIGCAVTTGVGAALNEARVEPGSSVAVFGLGGIGLNVIQGARIAGAARIIGVDVHAEKRALGERFGMTEFVDASSVEDVPSAMADLTGGGADHVFESSSSPQAIEDAVLSSHPEWGQVVFVSVHGSDARLSIHPTLLLEGRRVRGSSFGGARGRRDVPAFVDWYMEGRLLVDELITNTMSIDDVGHAFELMREGQGVRSVVLHGTP